MPKESLKNLLKRHSAIILAVSAILIAALCDHRNVHSSIFEESDNILFALIPLDIMIFPFQRVMHSVFSHCPEWLEYATKLYMLLPAALTFIVCYSIRSAMAGIAALSFSLTFFFSSTVVMDFEQSIISSCILLSLGAYFSFRNNNILRISLSAMALAALIHTKGVCQPFAAFMLIMLIVDTLKSKKKKEEITVLVACSALLIFGLFAWSITASKESRNSIGFTESNSRMIPNLIAGAKGMISTTEGPIIELFVGNEPKSKLEILTIASRIIIENPIPVIKAPFIRTATLTTIVPIVKTLIILFILSFFFWEKNIEKNLPLYVAALYFYGIYIIMPIEPRYFTPAIYIMCCCAGLFVSDMLLLVINKKPRLNCLLSSLGLVNRFSNFIIGLCIVFHFTLWSLSIVLLLSFPVRHNMSDADFYLRFFPENIFLLKYPLRADFPGIHDIKKRIEIFEKTEGKIESQIWKRRWLTFISQGQDEYMKNRNYQKAISEETKDIEQIVAMNINTSNENTLYWQDVMLNAIKAFGKGDIKTGEHFSKIAMISCMLSHGYVRQQTSTEQNNEENSLSNKLSIESADRCSNEYSLLVLTLPPWLRTSKHNLLISEAFNLMIPENSKTLFKEKNSTKCNECCISRRNSNVFPLNCGLPENKTVFIIDSNGTVMDDLLAPPKITHRFPAFERLKKNAENNQKINERDLLTAIHNYESFLGLFDDEIMAKATVSPEITRSEYFKYKDRAAFELAWLYSLKGDMERSRHYLLETLRGRKDFPNREVALKAYFSLQHNTGGNNGKD